MILSYLFLLQCSEFLSIMIPTILFYLLKYVLHIETDHWKRFFYTHPFLKMIPILFFCEAIAFAAVYPFMIRMLSTYSSHPKLIALSIFALQLLPWVFKCKKLLEIIKNPKSENDDNAIYK